MATFQIPGNNFNGIGIGASAPAAGYYAVSITDVEMKSTDKATTRRVHVQFDNGFTMFTFMNVGVVTDEWLLTSTSNRKGYVEFVPGQKGVDGSYNTIKNWLTKTAFDALKASGETPSVAPTNTNGSSLGGLPRNTGAVGTANVAGNGAGAPTITTNLPPAPSLAQGVVS